MKIQGLHVFSYYSEVYWEHSRTFQMKLFPKTVKASVIRQKGDLKTGASRKQNTPIFRKTNISYPLICTRKWAYQAVRDARFSENLTCFVFLKDPCSGGKKCSIFENFDVLGFLEILVLRFALLPYYRQTALMGSKIIPD